MDRGFNMSEYSIKDLERLSGIKAHTIRIWEKRYGLIEPRRTSTNIRYYNDHDLKKIMNISILNTKGFKISKIVELEPGVLQDKVYELSQQATDYPVQVDRLVMAMVDLNERLFNDILSSLTLKIGFEETVVNILFPFLEKIGILWMTGNIHPAQEHFISNLIRQKLIVVTDALPLPERSSKKFLLFLREGELHELSLLFMNYLLRVNGFNTIYLGQTVPLEDLKKICEKHHPDFLVTSMISGNLETAPAGFLNILSETFPSQTIISGGRQLSPSIQKELPSNCIYTADSLHFRQFLHSL